MQKMLQRAVLLFTLFLLCFTGICLSGREGAVEVWIDTKSAGNDSGIPLRFRNVDPSEIESCIWYVGEEEVSRTNELTDFIPRPGDEEHFIRVEVAFRDGSVCEDSFYYSVLPVIYLESGTAYKEIPRGSSIEARLKLKGGYGTLPTEEYGGGAVIRIRGNSTSELSKHPFKVELEEKADLLGMGASRHWVLLANAIDPTLLRNMLVQDLAHELGADVWMDSRNVALIYNGEYQGVYQLSEQVRVGENRVDVYNWEDLCGQIAGSIVRDLENQGLAAREERSGLEELLDEDLCSDFSWMENPVFESASLQQLNESEGRNFPVTFDLNAYINMEMIPEPTGGVLLEMNNYQMENASLKTNYDLPVYFNRPYAGESYDALYTYIKEYLQSLEYAFHETDFTYHADAVHYRMTEPGWFDWDGEFCRLDVEYEPADFEAEQYDGLHYSELADFDSLLRNFLICELTVNYDGMKNSVFFYKDLDGSLFIGPAWDYDWAWGNSYSDHTIDTWKPEIWQTTDQYFGSEQYYQTVQWNRYLIRDPYFLVRVYEKYWEIRDTVIGEMLRDGGLIDQYAAELKPAADANDARWEGCRGDFAGMRFDEGIAVMKDFLEQRISWLDEQFASVETLRSSLGYYEVSDDLTVSRIDTDSSKDGVYIEVTTTLPDCQSVSFQINGTNFYQAEVRGGAAKLQVPEAALRTGRGDLNAVQVRAVDSGGNYIVNPEGTVEGEYENAVSNYGWFAWKS